MLVCVYLLYLVMGDRMLNMLAVLLLLFNVGVNCNTIPRYDVIFDYLVVLYVEMLVDALVPEG